MSSSNSIAGPHASSQSARTPLSSWALTIDETASELSTHLRLGLSADEVVQRRQQFGWNELLEAPPIPFWKKLLQQFRELMVWLLIVAAFISGVLGDWMDAAAIFAIVGLNIAISLFQEEKAGKALAALRKLSPPIVKVIRDGSQLSLAARDIMPGDIIELEAGDNIPADARLIKSFRFRVQEAALTGESVPVEKEADLVFTENTPLADRRNMVFMGTVASAGKADAVVVSTGMNTELGRIAGLLERFEAAPTPLQRRLTELGKLLIVACLVIVSVIFVLQLIRGGALLEVLVVSISLAVAAVPEGMPAVVTLTLALGLQRMVRRHAIVRKLASVETLGSVTVICSDKTGTLTRNEMTVREIATGRKQYRITGVGYAPHGHFLAHKQPRCDEVHRNPMRQPTPVIESEQYEPIDPTQETDLLQTLTIGAKCNHAQARPAGDGSGQWHIIGDPTEGALLVAALKAGLDSVDREERILYEIPFDSERKAMTVVRHALGKLPVLYTKGAPEVVLAKSIAERIEGDIVSLTDERRQRILHASNTMAEHALRVLALAYRPLCEEQYGIYEESNLIFAGLVGMIDPPREEASEAVRKCFNAGIRPIMITGDHPATALAIGRELRLASNDERVVTGQELDTMSDDELAARCEHTSIFARVTSNHKFRVVEAWQRQGQVVAMTGDGVNDAPAVKAADVGIAMGLTGSDVTKEAADIVLADDNFASIVNAVEEGRGIFDNIQKFVHYLLACNAGEVMLMFFAALMNWPLPLTAIQILWINLVTDGLPALALGAEPPERDIMRRRPRVPHEPVITVQRGMLILAHGALIAAVAILGFWIAYDGSADNLARARIVTFCIAAYSQIFFSIACRSQRFTMPQLGLLSNRFLFWAIAFSGLLQLGAVTLPFAQSLFEAPGDVASQWLLILVLSLVPATIVEVGKLLGVWWQRAALPLS